MSDPGTPSERHFLATVVGSPMRQSKSTVAAALITQTTAYTPNRFRRRVRVISFRRSTSIFTLHGVPRQRNFSTFRRPVRYLRSPYRPSRTLLSARPYGFRDHSRGTE